MSYYHHYEYFKVSTNLTCPKVAKMFLSLLHPSHNYCHFLLFPIRKWSYSPKANNWVITGKVATNTPYTHTCQILSNLFLNISHIHNFFLLSLFATVTIFPKSQSSVILAIIITALVVLGCPVLEAPIHSPLLHLFTYAS